MASKEEAGLSKAELAAMKEHLKDQKAAAKRGANRAEDEKAVLARIDEMEPADREMAAKVHALVTAAAPELAPKLWYGMPAYARDGKVVCFFQPAKKFGTRYSTLGFNDTAHLDDGDIWPVTYALNALTPAVEAKISALVKQAAG